MGWVCTGANRVGNRPGARRSPRGPVQVKRPLTPRRWDACPARPPYRGGEYYAPFQEEALAPALFVCRQGTIDVA